MKEPTEIVWTHVDEEFLHFDGYFLTEEERKNFEGEEYGQVLAVLDLVTHRVIYFDNIWRLCDKLTKAIEEAKKEYPPLQTIKIFEILDWEGESWGEIMVFDHDGNASIHLYEIAQEEFEVVLGGTGTGADSMFEAIIKRLVQIGYVAKMNDLEVIEI